MKRYSNRGNRATKTGFGEGLAAAGEIHPGLIVLGADITASVGANLFAAKFPERFLSLGIAEQNCAAVAAGLALEGFLPVFTTYGVFAALRAADQIRISLCYNNLHVIIGGAHAGISVGPDGATHQALEDIALMRALPNMRIFSPCDATQAYKAVFHAVNDPGGPVYLRFGREPVPDFTDDEDEFIPGKAQEFHHGDDLTIIATGHMAWEALQAAIRLEEEGIHARVLNFHTIKPLDRDAIISAARDTGFIITAEEHQKAGGLGSAVAEVVAQHFPVPMAFVGMDDSFGESGKPDELMKKYHMDAAAILLKARSYLNLL
jgi:transketolase